MPKFNAPKINLSTFFVLNIISSAVAEYHNLDINNLVPSKYWHKLDPEILLFLLGISLAALMISIIRNLKLAKKLKNHKETEDELRKSQDVLSHKTAILEAQLNSSTDGIMVIDDKGNRILQNKRVADIWKIPEDVHLRTDTTEQLQYILKMTVNPAQFFNQIQYLIDHPDVTRRDIIELINGTVLERYSGPVLGKDGKYYGRIWTFHDVTEYLNVERLLAAEKELLSITLCSIGDGVITTDTNGNILMINKVAQELTGWKSEEAVRQRSNKVFNIINEITRKECDCPVLRVLQTGQTIELVDCNVLLSKTGSEIVVSSRATPIKDDENKVIGVVLVFRDMTEELKLQTSMQKAQKLESIGVLAGGIAHDFNNFLSGIFGFLEIAKISVTEGKTDLTLENLNESLKVFNRARSLTHQLLTFSKGGVPVLKTIHFKSLIERCAQFALSGSNIECHLEIDENLSPCDCDEHQMEQVIDNIVINAKQAMPEGGVITITAVNIMSSDRSKRDNQEDNKYIKISIKDHGIGIPKESLNKIFDPFYTTKENGHGLGLATAFSIVKRHNGWIDVESESGKGSVFHVFIPASTKIIEENKMHSVVNLKGHGTILILDDEEFILKVISRLLANMGYSSVQARNGREAIEIFTNAEKNSNPFTACILDLTVPGGIGGKEIVSQMRKISTDAVIFAVSGYSNDPVIAKPMDHGFTDSIAKPFNYDEFSSFIGKWLIKKEQNSSSLSR